MITCETTKYNFLNTLSPLISLHFNRHHLKKIQATKKNGVKMLQNTTSMGTQKKSLLDSNTELLTQLVYRPVNVYGTTRRRRPIERRQIRRFASHMHRRLHLLFLSTDGHTDLTVSVRHKSECEFQTTKQISVTFCFTVASHQ